MPKPAGQNRPMITFALAHHTILQDMGEQIWQIFQNQWIVIFLSLFSRLQNETFESKKGCVSHLLGSMYGKICIESEWWLMLSVPTFHRRKKNRQRTTWGRINDDKSVIFRRNFLLKKESKKESKYTSTSSLTSKYSV